MRIGNAGIFVKDLEGAKKFFEDYFGATVLKTYNEEENNYYSYILQLDEGAWIELMTKPGIVDEPKDPNRTGLAHICIKVDNRPELDEIIKKFKQDGYKTLSEGQLVNFDLIETPKGLQAINVTTSVPSKVIGHY